MRRSNRLLQGGGGVLLFVVLALTTACSNGPGRSAEAFCDTLHSEKQRILSQFQDAQQAADATNDELASVLAGLGGSIQALGELRTYFHKLADHAPEEIRTEAEIVADAYDDQMDAAGNAAANPLGALASGLFGSMAISGQLDTMNQFALQNCGESI